MDSKGMGDFLNTAGPSVEAAGATLAGVGAYNKSTADRTAYDMQAQVADQNASYASAQASDAIRRGQTAVFNSQLRTNQLEGAQHAALAANGVELSSGSAARILSDTTLMGDNDVAILAANAAKEAWGYNVQEQNFRNNANLLRYRASMESPGTAAATSLLTSAGTVASRWYGARHNLNNAQN